jgi:hypothetical protein
VDFLSFLHDFVHGKLVDPRHGRHFLGKAVPRHRKQRVDQVVGGDHVFPHHATELGMATETAGTMGRKHGAAKHSVNDGKDKGHIRGAISLSLKKQDSGEVIKG